MKGMIADKPDAQKIIGLRPHVVLYWPVLMGMPVALFAPENILSSSSWLRSVIDFLGHHFQMIAALSSPTDFPQVAELFYSLMFLLAPILFFGLLCLPEDRIVSLEYHIKHKIVAPLIYFFIGYGIVLGLVEPPEIISPLGGQ